MFRFYTTTKEPVFVSFTQIFAAFIVEAREDSATSYWWRHREGEPLEELLDEMFTRKLQASPGSEAAVNQIVNALIVALDGGNYEAILEANPVELLSVHQGEAEMLPELVQGWIWCENHRIDRRLRAIFKIGERKFSDLMARREHAYLERSN